MKHDQNQMLVSYCLKTLLDHAEFFINMEKLMLLQVNEALEDPCAKSINEVDEQFQTPVPRPKPFYLFCDKGYKPKLEEDLCPKPSGASSLSDIPVIIVNKQCLYAACDNFDQFTDKLKEFIGGHRGDDVDFTDDLVYEHFNPVKYTDSQQLSEVKLESSILQVLQEEMPRIQTDEEIPNKCRGCELPWCSCRSDKESLKDPLPGHGSSASPENSKKTTISERSINLNVSSQLKSSTAGPSANMNHLEHAREPKLKKYMRYTEPKKCACALSTKNHLGEHLPAYMRNMSRYDAVKLPNYETCSDITLKKLVQLANPQKTPSPIVELSLKTKDVYTQCSDKKIDLLCTCFKHTNLDSCEPVRNKDQFILENVSPSYMKTRLGSFAVDRAHSLRQLIQDAPELKEMFYKK